MHRSTRSPLWTCAVGLFAATPAVARTVAPQGTVVAGFESPGTTDAVTAFATFDPDGSGPAPTVLVAGGGFAATASGLASHVATWNGSAWSTVGGGADGRIAALATFDTDGGGPLPASLFLAGAFTSVGGVGADRIARWDGSTFTPLGLGLDDWASALAVYDDDGAGPRAPALYVGGDFEHAGTTSALGIARWNGTAFEALGAGLDGPPAALLELGGALYAGGFFSTAGGVQANYVARWNGTSWSALATGFDGPVHALASFDADGAGPIAPVLVAGGAFRFAGTTAVNGVAAWNGSAWTALGTGIASSGAYPSVRALLAVTENGASKLYAAGLARSAGSVSAPSGAVPEAPGGQALLAVAAWDGSAWTTLGTGIACAANGTGRALASFDDDGDGTANLFLGGHMTIAGGASASGVARWNGSVWSRLGTGAGVGASVRAIAVGTIPLSGSSAVPVAIGGAFAAAGTTPANRVALWDGAAWRAVGNGPAGAVLDGEVHALCWQGASLFVGGEFTSSAGVAAAHVARWSGSGDPTALGSGLDGDVLALATYGSTVVAGGKFTSSGTTVLDGVAAWNEAAGAWTALGGGISGTVRALLVANDGSGLALYAGGEFDKADGAAAAGVARWDGTSWTGLGSGLCCGGVSSLALYGGALHAGGTIDTSGDEPIDGVARWNLATGTWTSLGEGLVGGRPTNALAMVEIDGELVVGGDFQRAGGSIAPHAARWNGSTWSPYGTGADGTVRALAIQSGTTPALWLGGDFTVIDGQATSRIARAQ